MHPVRTFVRWVFETPVIGITAPEIVAESAFNQCRSLGCGDRDIDGSVLDIGILVRNTHP